jgi:predicted MFS family arabinose efflux permease
MTFLALSLVAISAWLLLLMAMPETKNERPERNSSAKAE